MEQFLQQLLNGIAWGSIYALIALGYTMVYGVLKLINFAHGEVYMVGAMAGYYAAHALGFAAQPSLAGLFAVLAALDGRLRGCSAPRSSAWRTGRCAARRGWLR